MASIISTPITIPTIWAMSKFELSCFRVLRRDDTKKQKAMSKDDKMKLSALDSVRQVLY